MNKSVTRKARGGLEGYTVLDMMVVFAISTVCVVLGVPQMQDYIVRAKIVEALAESQSAKQRVIMTCLESPELNPLDNHSAGYGFLPRKYVQSIEIDGACSHPVITIVTDNVGIYPDPVLTLDAKLVDGSGNVAWNCLSDSRDSYLPEFCR